MLLMEEEEKRRVEVASPEGKREQALARPPGRAEGYGGLGEL